MCGGIQGGLLSMYAIRLFKCIKNVLKMDNISKVSNKLSYGNGSEDKQKQLESVQESGT